MNVVVESWRPIPGFPIHEASTEGRIRSVRHQQRVCGGALAWFPGKILNAKKRRDGYILVGVSKNRKAYVHVLVALAFIGPGADGEEVRHFDGVKANNRPGNLLWGTRSQNESDKKRHGRTRSGISTADVLRIRERYQRSSRKGSGTAGAIARDFGLHRSTVLRIATGRTWPEVRQ